MHCDQRDQNVRNISVNGQLRVYEQILRHGAIALKDIIKPISLAQGATRSHNGKHACIKQKMNDLPNKIQ